MKTTPMSNEEYAIIEKLTRRPESDFGETMQSLREIEPRDATRGPCRLFARKVAEACVGEVGSLAADDADRKAILTHAEAAAVMVVQQNVGVGFMTLGECEPSMIDAAMTAIAKWK